MNHNFADDWNEADPFDMAELPHWESRDKRFLSMQVEYEIAASWWTGFLPWPLHSIAARYIVWSTRRKVKRFWRHRRHTMEQEIRDHLAKLTGKEAI